MKGKSRLLIMNDWYEEFMPGTYLEDDLEKTIISKADEVFPEYYMLPFKQTIHFEGESSDPDLCLIKKDYSIWYVIEVELAKKPFKGHTEKQIRVFSQGRYNARAISKYLVGKKPSLDSTKLEQLIRADPPKVLVMVNEYPKWADEVLTYPRTGIMVFGLYDHPHGVEAYRLDGQYPVFEIGRSRCKFPKHPANTLKVENSSLLTINHKERLIIYYDGRKTLWERQNHGPSTVLIPVGFNPLNVRKQYFLIKSDKDEYFLREN
jgi:hypothetical protein